LPKYLKKKNFGEVPVYIKQRQEDVKKAQDEYSSFMTDYFRRGAMREMAENERRTIIDGLKKTMGRCAPRISTIIGYYRYNTKTSTQRTFGTFNAIIGKRY